MYHARDGFSLFQDKKFDDRDNSSFKLPDEVLCYMSQFVFVASKDQEKQISMNKISMIKHLWRWHNTVDTPAVVQGEAGGEFTLCNDFNALKVQ